MGGEWKDTSLGEVLKFSNGKTSLERGDFFNVPVYGSNGVIGYANDHNSPEDSIIIGRVGSYCGSVYHSPSKCWVTDNAIKATAINANNPKFLFYLLGHLRLNQWREGSGQPLLNQTILKSIDVTIPHINDQKAISHILGTLDNKIELNRQMNATLEAMAQALFKSWFVDFDPVIDNALAAGNPIPEELQARADARAALGDKRKALPESIQKQFPSRFVFTEEMGWVPEGWEVALLESITTAIRRGVSPKYIENGGVRVINQKCIRDHSVNYALARRNDETKKKIDGRELIVGDILVNSTGVGTLGRMAQVLCLDETTVVDSHVTVVRTNAEKYKPYTFARMMLSLEPRIEAMGEGSTGQTELSRANLQAIPVLVPPLGCQEWVEKTFFDSAQKMVANTDESETLIKLRDTLLPKLLSGELRIPDAEKLAAEAV